MREGPHIVARFKRPGSGPIGGYSVNNSRLASRALVQINVPVDAVLGWVNTTRKCDAGLLLDYFAGNPTPPASVEASVTMVTSEAI